MKIEAIYHIKGRGTVLGCVSATQPHQGSILRHADGRVWLITGVERFCVQWAPGEKAGLLIRPAAEGQAEPVEGDEVEMVEPLTLAALIAEAEHNVRTLRAALSEALDLAAEAIDTIEGGVSECKAARADIARLRALAAGTAGEEPTK